LERHARNGAVSSDDEAATLPLVHRTDGKPKEKEYGENTRLVRHAISKMTRDYNIRDLYRYLQAFGHDIGINAIATVLIRLKKIKEIQERVPGSGRRPALFKR